MYKMKKMDLILMYIYCERIAIQFPYKRDLLINLKKKKKVRAMYSSRPT